MSISGTSFEETKVSQTIKDHEKFQRISDVDEEIIHVNADPLKYRYIDEILDETGLCGIRHYGIRHALHLKFQSGNGSAVPITGEKWASKASSKPITELRHYTKTIIRLRLVE